MRGHIFRRSKTSWTIKHDIAPDPETGRRRTRQVAVKGTKRDAERELTRILGEIERGGYVEPTRMTVGEWLVLWLSDYAPSKVSAKTLERYAEILHAHLRPALGAIRLRDLTPDQVQAFYNRSLASGRLDGQGGLSPQTVKHHHRLLSQALRRAKRSGHIDRNVCELVDPPTVERRDMAILDNAETSRLLRATEGRRIYMPILLALWTGMRRGEVLALKWRNVDLTRAELRVVQSLEQTREGLRFKAPKSGRGRVIALSASIVQALRKHEIEQKKERLRLGPIYQDNGLVVAMEDGRPYRPHHITQTFRETARALGLAVRFHDLRHTHLSQLLAAGVHPKIASERAGHASVAITLDIYSHAVPSLQEDAAQRFDEIMSGTLKD